ncbi:hypothetical protein N7495_005886 [Penicillium taxi]|uniref:uncharacterized protein n=1 Tax=Penicillium taxi TaxID=168475 RepID=UPI002545BCD5|nr:uncharacterized protein N7495_005886 [Penicillium taxi]KAJ5894195.1 hypothetical protein N7495_005886 [Penicillium taxi]
MSENSHHPIISVTLGLSPTDFSIGPGSPPTFTITATLLYDKPITILTYATIFNLDLSLQRSNFTCHDITTGDIKPVELDYTKGGRRPSFNRESGGRDDRYFCTLVPTIPVVFQEEFCLANQSEDLDLFVAGHKYRLTIKKGEKVAWWMTGSKEEVMTPPGKRSGLGHASGGPILLEADELEFNVV